MCVFGLFLFIFIFIFVPEKLFSSAVPSKCTNDQHYCWLLQFPRKKREWMRANGKPSAIAVHFWNSSLPKFLLTTGTQIFIEFGYGVRIVLCMKGWLFCCNVLIEGCLFLLQRANVSQATLQILSILFWKLQREITHRLEIWSSWVYAFKHFKIWFLMICVGKDKVLCKGWVCQVLCFNV